MIHRGRFSVIAALVVASIVALAATAGGAGASQSSAMRAQNAATQAARDAARVGERLHSVQVQAEAAARQAAAANAKAHRTRSFGDVARAKAATINAARLGAAAARAQLHYTGANAHATRTQRAADRSVLDDAPNDAWPPPGGANPGTISHTTESTVARAQLDATQAHRKALQDAREVATAQARLDRALANPRSTPEEIAALQAALTKKQADAAASAADDTEAATNATREAASFLGYSDGTAVEGPTIPETEPVPDNLDTCPTTTGPTEPCSSDNVQLVGHTGGFKTGGSPSCPAFNPTKCPGFSSLNFVTGYTHLGYDFMIANGTSGLSVWSLKDPAHPAMVSTIPYTDLNNTNGAVPVGTNPPSQFWEGENETVDSARKLVFMSRDVGVKGLFIINLKDPWHPQIVAFQKVPQGHTATCLNDCRFIWSVGGVASGSGAGYTGKNSPVSVTDIRDPSHPFTSASAFAAQVNRSSTPTGSTHSVDVDFDGVAWVSASRGVRGYWTSGKHLNPVSTKEEWATPYAPLPYAGGQITGNLTSFMHNSYHFPTSLNGRPAGDVLLVTNESNNTNCANAGVFILASLAGTYDTQVFSPQPVMDRLSTFSVNGKPGQFHGAVGTTTVGDCSSHWFTVRGNLVAAAFYEQGLRLIDVSNPAAPVQVGYGRVPVRAPSGDTPAIVSSDVSAPYWHGKYIYMSDYQRGVDVWKYTGPIPGVVQPRVCWNSCEK